MTTTSFFIALSITIQVLAGYNLVLPLVLYIIYQLKRHRHPAPTAAKEWDYAIIVTAYEQTDTVPAAVNSLLQLDYNNYIIYVVADKCDVSNLKFDDERVVVLRPEETLASNTRSHFYAINHFVRQHELLTIIDSDNLADPEYLNELNRSFNAGFSAVQGVRKAKNLDTTFACLDAARDIYYHFYDGSVLYHLGSSATLAGSGMAFTTALYRECLERLDISGAGFDKVLQNEIVSRGHRIAFNEGAIVYDEKTSNSEQLVKQRARWINTWFKYCKYGLSLAGAGIRQWDRNKFLFGITLMRPPLFIFLILSAICLGANVLLGAPGTMAWLAGFACFIAGFAIPVLHPSTDKRIVRSLVNIPRFMFLQVRSLLLSRGANKLSVATRHYNKTTLSEIKDPGTSVG
ncbi:MAG: glycosyltransferase [Bacteroidota bacterium]